MQTDQDPRLGLPSASGIDRRWHCPGSAAAEKDLTELKTEDVTDTGTRIHEALESGDDEDLELSEKEVKTRIAHLEEFAVAQWKEHFKVEAVKTVTREERFWIHDPETLKPIASAQPDVVYDGITIYGSEVGLVLNYKTGFAKQTPSERNWQCKTEVLAISEDHQFTSIRGGIVASRLYSKLDTTDYTVEDIVNIGRDLRFAFWRSMQPDAPRNPGPHCRWCKARGVCPESATYAMVTAKGTELAGLKSPIDVNALITRLDPSDLKRIWERKSLVEQIVEGSVERLKMLPPETLTLIGLQLAPGNRLKPITDVKKAWERLEKELGHDAMLNVISIARGKAAEVLCEQKGISLKKAKEEVDVILGDAITEKEGAKKLKPV